jgi:hypothetical protein
MLKFPFLLILLYLPDTKPEKELNKLIGIQIQTLQRQLHNNPEESWNNIFSNHGRVPETSLQDITSFLQGAPVRAGSGVQRRVVPPFPPKVPPNPKCGFRGRGMRILNENSISHSRSCCHLPHFRFLKWGR